MTGLKTPTGKRQPVGYLQAWPRILTRDNQEQIQQRAGERTRTQSRTRTQDRRIAAGFQVQRADRWPLNHAAFFNNQEKNIQTDVIYLDFPKVFHSVVHKIFVTKLSAHGISCK